MVTWACFFGILKLWQLLHFLRYGLWKVTGKIKLDQLSKPNWKRITPDESYWLYLIKCRGNKYYVGITNNLHRRRKEEFSQGNRCPKWLLRHRPQKYLGVLPLQTRSKRLAETIETRFTKRLFKVYGRRNVRGGRYAAPDLFNSRR